MKKRLERKKQDRFLEDIERLTLTNDRVIFNRREPLSSTSPSVQPPHFHTDNPSFQHTPQFHTKNPSVPHHKTPQFNTKNSSVPHHKTPQFNTKTPSVQHWKPLSSTPKSPQFNTVVIWGMCWTEKFLVWNWEVFGVTLRIFSGTEWFLVWNWGDP